MSQHFDPHQPAHYQQDAAYPPYASAEHFSTQDYVGQDASGRRDQYPPIRGGEGGEPGPGTYHSGDYGGYEKGTNPVSRGSIAAQVSPPAWPRKRGAGGGGRSHPC